MATWYMPSQTLVLAKRSGALFDKHPCFLDRWEVVFFTSIDVSQGCISLWVASYRSQSLILRNNLFLWLLWFNSWTSSSGVRWCTFSNSIKPGLLRWENPVILFSFNILFISESFILSIFICNVFSLTHFHEGQN